MVKTGVVVGTMKRLTKLGGGGVSIVITCFKFAPIIGTLFFSYFLGKAIYYEDK